MKKQFSLVALVVFILSFSFLLGGCFSFGKNIDGIQLSKVNYEHQIAGHDVSGEYYSLKFSCRVKNTTGEDLQFEIVYSARYGGILSTPTKQTETIVLRAKESKDLSYTRERVGEQIYNKSIEILNVKAYVVE